jgi:thioredoxin 1
MAEITITKDNFEAEVIKSEKPVLLDFWAVWCGPCRMIGPVVAEIAQEHGDKIKVGKVNVDDEPELAAAFKVSSIPMLAIVDGGKIVDTTVGAMPKASLEAFLGDYI